MTERQLKSLILFLLESVTILDGIIINEDFAEILNDFIYKQYQLDYKSLNIIFNIDILKDFIEEKYDIISLSQINQLIYSYRSLINYAKLVEEIGIEDDWKINELALLFTEYYNEIIELSCEDNSIWYPNGYLRIKQ